MKAKGIADELICIQGSTVERFSEEECRAMWRLVSMGMYDVKWDDDSARVLYRPVLIRMLAWTETSYPPPGTDYVEERIELKKQLHRDIGFLIDAKVAGFFFTDAEDAELKVYALDRFLDRIQLLMESVLAVDWRRAPPQRAHTAPSFRTPSSRTGT